MGRRLGLLLVPVACIALSGGGSARATQRVHRSRARITLAPSDALPAPGERVTLSGSVSPSEARQPITLQTRTRGGWQTVARTRLNRRSRYSVSRTFHRNQTVRLRAFLPGGTHTRASYSPVVALPVAGMHRIKHVVVIMQENRSFDQYFATYPGADGINPASPPCVPDPLTSGQACAYLDHNDRNNGGPHGVADMMADMNCADFASRAGCKMDGFVGRREQSLGCDSNPTSQLCGLCTTASTGPCLDVMGYHDGSDLPNYWSYAHDFVLQDHMFAPNDSWSLPQHLFMVSEWSANCANVLDPFTCINAPEAPVNDQLVDPSMGYSPNDGLLHYAWTDLTYLLYKAGVSWGYYVYTGTEPDCPNGSTTCAPVPQSATTPGIWNPLPSFTDVHQDHQLGNIQTLSNFFAAAKSGTLPAVSWIDPTDSVSEHPTNPVSAGQRYVTGLINAIMQGPDWSSTAIFVSWDDWSGFYDNAVPPSIDENGFGMRVPGLVISPYAKRGYIDHEVLSHDDYNKFIEDDFLGGERLDPKTDGRPDPRPDVRESLAPGNLINDFDFSQSPRAPEILPVCPQTALRPTPVC